jgi:transposase
MQRTTRTKNSGFTATDRCRLLGALRRTGDVRTYRRLQAVLWVAQGQSIPQVAHHTQTRPWVIYSWVRRYRKNHRPEALVDAPRSGRPQAAPAITDARIRREVRRDPFQLGYNTTTWTVSLLAEHLFQKYRCAISVRPLRRRMRSLGLRWKRPRYVYATKDPHRIQKKGPLFAV